MTAIEKFIDAMNKSSQFWQAKDVEITAQNGNIVMVKWQAWTWKSDEGEQHEVGE